METDRFTEYDVAYAQRVSLIPMEMERLTELDVAHAQIRALKTEIAKNPVRRSKVWCRRYGLLVVAILVNSLFTVVFAVLQGLLMFDAVALENKYKTADSWCPRPESKLSGILLRNTVLWLIQVLTGYIVWSVFADKNSRKTKKLRNLGSQNVMISPSHQ